MKIKVRTKAAPHLYWGPGPLPAGAEFCGTVTRDETDTGALIRMATGIFVQGNAGAIRSLPQSEVSASLAASALGSRGGSVSSPAKAEAVRRNGLLGGDPRKSKRVDDKPNKKN